MIVPVKKASIAILKENYDDVIKSLQKSSVIMIIDGEAHDRKTSLDLSQSLMADVEQSIKLLKKYEQKKPLFGSYLETDLEEFFLLSSHINMRFVSQIFFGYLAKRKLHNNFHLSSNNFVPHRWHVRLSLLGRIFLYPHTQGHTHLAQLAV